MNTAQPNQIEHLEKFIPISLNRLVSDLLQSPILPPEQFQLFQLFCQRYIALTHALTHHPLLQLKQVYEPFNPDQDNLIEQPKDHKTQITAFKHQLCNILEKANYQQLSRQALIKALNKVSPHGVQVSVDFDEFDDVYLFYRGSSCKSVSFRDWKTLYLKTKTADVQIFQRLFVLVQPKNKQQWIDHLVHNKKVTVKKAEKKVSKVFKSLGISGEQEAVYLKLFKDIPGDDLEMLFPNTRIRIRLFDKIKLGIMGGGGTAGGIMATISKFSAAIDPVSAVIAIGGLLGVLWRQIAKIFSQRAKYSAILTRNLYFYSLDNNMGALNHLLDAAEEEENKEAILAYFFLLMQGQCTPQLLDRHIENHIQQTYRIPMDFDIVDGLEKLRQAQLVTGDNSQIQAIPLAEAHKALEQQWQNLLKPPNTHSLQGDRHG